MELRHIIAARLHLLHRRSCPWSSEEPPEDAYLGQYGELAAASYLRAQGLRVLRSNFRHGKTGELDLVCRDGNCLVFVEVKSSGSLSSGAPARRVNRDKRQRLRQAARHWMFLLGRSVPFRFDIVELYLLPREVPRIRHQRGAFRMEEGEAWASSHAS